MKAWHLEDWANLSILASALATTLLDALHAIKFCTNMVKLKLTVIVTIESIEGNDAVNLYLLYTLQGSSSPSGSYCVHVITMTTGFQTSVEGCDHAFAEN